MYSIKAINRTGEEYYIYRDSIEDKTLKLNSPKLDLIENSAGTLNFKMMPNNIGYALIDRLTTELIVYRKNEEIWRGRIISIKEDFFKNKSVTCEGELAYLNDTTQPQELYSGISFESLLNTYLNVHNEKVDNSKKFYKGTFEYDTSINTGEYEEIYTNYDTTFKAISDTILSVSNGYIYLTKNNGQRFINHKPYSNRPYNTQVINFGKNLLDFTKNYDSTSFATVLLPLGARLENKYGINMSGIDGVQAYTTVEDVNNGSPYVKNDNAVNTYGWIEATVNFDDIDDEEELLETAQNYLSDVQYDTMTLEVSVVDLSYIDVDAEQLHLSDRVRVVSKPHGLDRYFPITKISIPLDNPAGTTFTMGAEGVLNLTTRTVQRTTNIEDQIKIIPTQEEILHNAKVDSGNLISAFTRGYITITQRDNGSNELYVTENPVPIDYNADNPASGVESIQKYWRWNFNGLEFVNKAKNIAAGDPENKPEVAITMNGEVNANMITTGVLNAGIIQAGILKNANWGKGSDVFYLDLDNGILKMNATNLSIGGSAAATQAFANSAANNAVDNLSGYSILNKIKNGNYLGLYYSGNQFYISASYIKTGTLELGGVVGGVGQGGVLNVYDSSSVLTHKLSNDGLISIGHNYTSTTVYNVKYGKAGNLDDNYAKVRSSTWYANLIGYYISGQSSPFAYIGLKGNVSGSNVTQSLSIINKDRAINIYGKTEVNLSSDGIITQYCSGGRIEIQTYSGNDYSYCNIYSNKIDIYSTGSNSGHIVLENNTLYMDGGGLGSPFLIDSNKIKISRRLVIDAGAGIYDRDSGGSNLMTRWSNAYNWASEYNDNGLGYEKQIDYKGEDGGTYHLYFNSRGQLVREW